MNKFLFLFFLFISIDSFSQESINAILKKYNTESIPYMTVDSLKTLSNNVIVLDAREKKEFTTSHLKNALFVGYEKFNLKKTIKSLPNKETTIVVYCTLGVRSEDIAEKLKMKGYQNVYNLFGGIVEWKNKGYKVFDTQEKETEQVHTSSKFWGRWLLKGEKVY